MPARLRPIEDLLTWLEYGRTSGYIAARQSKEQEEHWADLLRTLIKEHDDWMMELALLKSQTKD